MDKLTKQILEEADNLDAYLRDEVEAIFLPNEVLQYIDYDADDWEDRLRNEMSPMEREWYDLVEEMIDSLIYFKCKYKE